MKTDDIVDTLLSERNSAMVIELPNGQRHSLTKFYFDTNERGESIIVLRTGKKTKTKRY